MSEHERFVAVTLLTQRDLDRLGDNLRNVYPLTGVEDFSQLLQAIDEADRRDEPDEDAPAAA